MQKKAGLLVFSIGLCLSYAQAQSIPPREPVTPVVPVVPGANQNRRSNVFPAPPPMPARGEQNEMSARIIDSYELTILGAYPNGNTRNNAASTINTSGYVLYSNGNMEIKLIFTDGTEYVYHLRNPRSKIEINTGLYRETFDTLIQVDNQFILDSYTCELTYNENTVTSFNLIGDNRVIVLLNIRRK